MEKVNKLYVGNMSFDTTEDELRAYFEQNGITPKSVTLIKDKYTGKAKGFGFVEVESQEAVQKATEAMNSKEFSGRTLTVNEAKPPKERFGGSGFGSGGNSRY
jgi:RNA recognition motif-containing protein